LDDRPGGAVALGEFEMVPARDNHLADPGFLVARRGSRDREDGRQGQAERHKADAPAHGWTPLSKVIESADFASRLPVRFFLAVKLEAALGGLAHRLGEILVRQ